jgi:hypothetical protein
MHLDATACREGQPAFLFGTAGTHAAWRFFGGAFFFLFFSFPLGLLVAVYLGVGAAGWLLRGSLFGWKHDLRNVAFLRKPLFFSFARERDVCWKLIAKIMAADDEHRLAAPTSVRSGFEPSEWKGWETSIRNEMLFLSPAAASAGE